MSVVRVLRRIDKARRTPSQRLLDAIYGPQAKDLRSLVASELLGKPVTKSSKEAQYGNLRKALLEAVGVTGNCIAAQDAEFERIATEMLSAERTFTSGDSFADKIKAAKERHPGMICLFRMGDFYEAFDADAEKVAKELGLTLTKRGELSMCGFPYHALEKDLRHLLGSGFRVAVCDPVE